MWPALNPYLSNLAFAKVRCVGRRLPRTSPDFATSRIVSVDPADPTRCRLFTRGDVSGSRLLSDDGLCHDFFARTCR